MALTSSAASSAPYSSAWPHAAPAPDKVTTAPIFSVSCACSAHGASNAADSSIVILAFILVSVLFF